MVSGLWFPGEPNSIRSGMQCVNMGEIGQGYRLNDYTCANSLPYLCEIDLWTYFIKESDWSIYHLTIGIPDEIYDKH